MVDIVDIPSYTTAAAYVAVKDDTARVALMTGTAIAGAERYQGHGWGESVKHGALGAFSSLASHNFLEWLVRQKESFVPKKIPADGSAIVVSKDQLKGSHDDDRFRLMDTAAAGVLYGILSKLTMRSGTFVRDALTASGSMLASTSVNELIINPLMLPTNNKPTSETVTRVGPTLATAPLAPEPPT